MHNYINCALISYFILAADKTDEIRPHLTSNMEDFISANSFVIQKTIKRMVQNSEQDSVLTGFKFSSDNICKLADYIKGIADKRQQLNTFSRWIELQLETDALSREDIMELEFTSDEIRKLVEHVRGIRRDSGQLRDFFEQMGRQLEDVKNELYSIDPELNIATSNYAKDEDEITNTLAMLHRYLNDTEDESIRNYFFQQVAILPTTLNSLINGLLGLGKSFIRGDIMIDLCEAVQVKVL